MNQNGQGLQMTGHLSKCNLLRFIHYSSLKCPDSCLTFSPPLFFSFLFHQKGGTTCLQIQDELLWIMTQSDLMSQKTSKTIWELVTSDGHKKTAAKGQSFSKGDFETYNWNNMKRLKSILTVGQQLLDCQQVGTI